MFNVLLKSVVPPARPKALIRESCLENPLCALKNYGLHLMCSVTLSILFKYNKIPIQRVRPFSTPDRGICILPVLLLNIYAMNLFPVDGLISCLCDIHGMNTFKCPILNVPIYINVLFSIFNIY